MFDLFFLRINTLLEARQKALYAAFGRNVYGARSQRVGSVLRTCCGRGRNMFRPMALQNGFSSKENSR